MKRLFLLGALAVGLICPAHAGHFCGYEWKGWRLSTNEGFNLDTGPSNVRNNRVAFPMTQLLDGDPNTTWVWDDTAWKKHRAASTNLKKYPARSLSLRSEKPVVADELWLMNGYNKRADLFKRNDRVVEIQINFDSKPVKRVSLADQMGWRKIALPRRAFRELQIELTGIRKGDGEDNDICLSELALYSRGKKIDFQMPRAVIYHLSYCCGGTGWLLSRDGRVITEGQTGEGAIIEWSPDGRRVAGMNSKWKNNKVSSSIWIADAWRARVVKRASFGFEKDVQSLRWKNNRTLEALAIETPQGKYRERVVQRIASPA